MEEDDLVWRVALEGWCCWFQGPLCCSRISQLFGRLMVGVFLGTYLAIIGRSPLVIYWPAVCFNSNNCHGCHSLYRLPCVDELVKQLDQLSCVFVPCDTTYSLFLARGCNHWHPHICPLPVFSFCTNLANSSKFYLFFPSLQRPYTQHKNSLLAHKHKQFSLLLKLILKCDFTNSSTQFCRGNRSFGSCLL